MGAGGAVARGAEGTGASRPLDALQAKGPGRRAERPGASHAADPAPRLQ
jgi:hypothetical protein